MLYTLCIDTVMSHLSEHSHESLQHWSSSHNKAQQHCCVDLTAELDILLAVGEMIRLRVRISENAFDTVH